MSLLSRIASAFLLAAGLAIPAAAVPFNVFDTSGNANLHGNYFVRELLLTNVDPQGNAGDALSAVGTLTFDGAGNYTFTGSVMESHPLTAGPQPTTRTITGKYAAGANGFLRIDSLVGTVDSKGTPDEAFGGVGAAGPYAFVASTTESPVPSFDLFIGIPMSGVVSNTSFRGNYNAAWMNVLNGDTAKIRDASFQLRPNGLGNLGDVAITGYAADQGSTQLSQSISSGTYALAAVSTLGGTISFGSGANLLSGDKAFMVSDDGSIILAGAANGFDMLVGTPEVSTATPDLFKGFYFLGALEDDASGLVQLSQSSIDAFYGSSSATGAGGLYINHLRFEKLGFFPYDFTYDDYYSIPASGVFQPRSDADVFMLGAGGKVVVMGGTSDFYSLMIGLQAPDFSGPVPFLNPVGIVNAANFAPATNPVSPLEMVVLFGNGLAALDFDALTLPVPTETPDHVKVLVNGIAAPIFRVRAHTNPQLIYVLVPSGITPANGVSFATFQVFDNNNEASNTVTLYTNYTSPGVFAASQGGVGDAAALHPGNVYSVVSAAAPAKLNETIELFADGLGTVYPLIAPDGAGAPLTPPFSLVDANTHIYVGGWDASLPFKGMAPGYTGLYQINLTVPQIPASDWYLDLTAIDSNGGDGGENLETRIPVSATTVTAGTTSAAARPAPKQPSRRAASRGGMPRTPARPVSGRLTHTAQ